MLRHIRRTEPILRWAYDIVQRGKWATLDTETTGKDMSVDQVVSWAICRPVAGPGNHLLIQDGLVRPTIAITPGAYALHRISESSLQEVPSFASVCPEIQRHLSDVDDLVIYNARFDLSVIGNSAVVHGLQYDALNRIDDDRHHCLMRKYAVYHGDKNVRYGSYVFQKLGVACEQMGISLDGVQLHGAAEDARMTALLLLKLAEVARAELPDLSAPSSASSE